MVIKRILTGVMVASGITVTGNFLPTQAQQPCFLQGANGQNLDLGHLCGGQSASTTKTGASTASNFFQVPIKRRESGIPVVEVTFNGKHTFEMLFDTGASGITITTDMAKKMGIKSQFGGMAETAGGKVPIGIGRVSSVKAGQVVGQNLSVAITPSLSGLGLLGQEFYGHYDVTIKQNMIEMRPRK